MFNFDQRLLDANRPFGDDYNLDPSDFQISKTKALLSPRIALFVRPWQDHFSWIRYEMFAQAPPYQLMHAGSVYLNEALNYGSFGYASTADFMPTQTRQFELGDRFVLSDHVWIEMAYFRRKEENTIRYLLKTTPDAGYKSVFTPENTDRKTYGIDAILSFSGPVFSGQWSGQWMDSRELVNLDLSGFTSAWLGFDNSESYMTTRWARRFATNLDGMLRLSKDNRMLSKSAVVDAMSFSLLFNFRTGTHYTPQTPAVLDFHGQSAGKITARMNSEKMPSSTTIDTRLEVKKAIRSISVGIVLDILNILDSRNAEDVYAATGSARTDGYLNSPIGEMEAAARGPRFVQHYQIREKNGFNYAAPRQVRLGLRLEF